MSDRRADVYLVRRYQQCDLDNPDKNRRHCDFLQWGYRNNVMLEGERSWLFVPAGGPIVEQNRWGQEDTMPRNEDELVVLFAPVGHRTHSSPDD